MDLLTILSLGYAGVLVAALALSLVLICLALRRTSRALADVQASLEATRASTGSLDRDLAPLCRLDGALLRGLDGSHERPQERPGEGAQGAAE